MRCTFLALAGLLTVCSNAVAGESVFFRMPAHSSVDTQAGAFLQSEPVLYANRSFPSVRLGTKGIAGKPVYTLIAGDLPKGVFLNSATGAIVGRPIAPSVMTGLVIKAEDVNGKSTETAPFALIVLDTTDLWIAPIEDITLQIGRPVNIPIEHGADEVVEWRLAYGSGPLPPGLAIGSAGVPISGSPNAEGTWTNIRIEARHKGRVVVSAPFSITIGQYPPVGAAAALVPGGVSLDQGLSIELPLSSLVNTVTISVADQLGDGGAAYILEASPDGRQWHTVMTFIANQVPSRMDDYPLPYPVVAKALRLSTISSHTASIMEFSVN